MSVHLEREIKVLLKEQIEHHVSNLIHGGAIEDYAGYKELIGKIAGLRRAFEICDEAVANVSKGE